MAIYCKAYLVSDLRRFAGWKENSSNVAPAEGSSDADAPSGQLGEDSILYLHDNHVVTDGAFRDEHVIFDVVSPEWIEFCEHTLAFAIPSDLVRTPAQASSSAVVVAE